MPFKIIGTLNVYMCRCFRCGHKWKATGTAPPVACANCKSRSWNVKPGTVKIGRPPNKEG